ncbi:MAG: CotH kinase family protein [Verrucomicrobiales bacterium]
MPDYYDPANAPQYYGTVPADPAIATNLPLLHWFIQNPSAAATTAGTRCSLYFLGEFYDNIEINIHGQSTRGAAFAKKSHNLDFNRGERFRWSPDAPRVKDINFMTNFADKTKMRHPLCYELHREAGCPAHFAFTMRVQQNGAFYGLMDFIEDADDVYLDRAGLNPDGALYKMYNNMANPATNAAAGAEKKNRREENNADLQAFLDGMHQANVADRKAFFFDNLDIPRMISFMAATSVSSNHDVHSKNYYIYRDTGRTNEWTLLPWDLDLSMGRRWTSTNNYFDDLVMVDHPIRNATGQNLVAKLYGISEFNEMAKRRIRSLNDRFLQRVEDEPDPAQRWMERRMDENLALLGDDLILDYNKWVLGSATGHGPWKLTVDAVNGDSPFRDHTPAQEVQRVKDEYLTGRRAFVYSHGDTVAAQDAADPPPLSIAAAEVSPASGNQDEEFIEIANANAVAVDISDWRLAEAVEFTFRPGTVIPPNTSLFVSPDVNAFRARAASPTGGESRFVQGGYQGHLSNLGETIRLIDAGGTERAAFSTPAEPTDLQRFLVVSEFCYHPVNGAAEFIELANMSADLTLDLGGAYFSQGIAFTFPGGTQLAPGERTLVVRDLAAFEAEHGSGLPVAGAFAGGSALDNAGETIKLEDAIGQTIREFTYDDADPWHRRWRTPRILARPALSRANPRPQRPRQLADQRPARRRSWRGGHRALLRQSRGGRRWRRLQRAGTNTGWAPAMAILATPPGRWSFGFDGGRTLTLLRSAVADDTEVAIELSASLQDGGWQPLDAAQRIESEPDPSGRWREVWALPAEFGDTAFARLKVVWR